MAQAAEFLSGPYGWLVVSGLALFVLVALPFAHAAVPPPVVPVEYSAPVEIVAEDITPTPVARVPVSEEPHPLAPIVAAIQARLAEAERAGNIERAEKHRQRLYALGWEG